MRVRRREKKQEGVVRKTIRNFFIDDYPKDIKRASHNALTVLLVRLEDIVSDVRQFRSEHVCSC